MYARRAYAIPMAMMLQWVLLSAALRTCGARDTRIQQLVIQRTLLDNPNMNIIRLLRQPNGDSYEDSGNRGPSLPRRHHCRGSHAAFAIPPPRLADPHAAPPVPRLGVRGCPFRTLDVLYSRTMHMYVHMSRVRRVARCVYYLSQELFSL